MTDAVTNSVAQYVKEVGVKISAVARGTNIPDGILRRSLSERKRNLRAEEFLQICAFLGREPRSFHACKSNGERERARG